MGRSGNSAYCSSHAQNRRANFNPSIRSRQRAEHHSIRTIVPNLLGGDVRGKVIPALLLVATDDARPLQVAQCDGIGARKSVQVDAQRA